MNRHTLTARLLGVCAVVVLLAGCNAVQLTDDEPGATPTPSRSATTQASPDGSAEPSVSPDVSTSASAPSASATEPSVTAEPSASAEPEARTPTSFRDRLLTADEMPALDAASAWRVERIRGREGRRPFGTCQEFDMLSIGATRVAVASYLPDGPLRADAGHMVVDFVDAETARRAYEVLRSWRQDCAAGLGGYARTDIGRIMPVSGTRADAAGWYRLTYGPVPGNADADYVDAQGLVLRGTRITVLEIQVVAEDPQSVDPPMATAVRRAAGLL